MRLTNTMRDAFVRAAMDDVPSVDYDEQIRSLAVKTAVAALPAKVQAVWKDADTKHHLETSYINFRHARVSLQIPGAVGDGSARTHVETVCAPLAEKAIEQTKARDELQRRLHAVAYSVSTRKALVDALPEFEKYLPADEPAAIKTLPVIANVVADFVKAGWPKGKKAA
jgi:hypothetical protein